MDTKSNANIRVVDMHNFVQFEVWEQVYLVPDHCLFLLLLHRNVECVLMITITSGPNSRAAPIPYFTNRQSI